MEQLENEKRKAESKQRLAKLKGRGEKTTSAEAQHVNLFEPEERAMVETVLVGNGKEKKQSSTARGIVPVRLDSVVPKNKNDQPFYMRDPAAPRNDAKRKAQMDPMKAFVKKETRSEGVSNRSDTGETITGSASGETHRKSSLRRKRSRQAASCSSDSEDSRARQSSRKRRHDKKRRKQRSSSEKCGSKGVTMEELRRRRQAREHKESVREAALLRRQTNARNDGGHRYQDQFHPSLSRR